MPTHSIHHIIIAINVYDEINAEKARNFAVIKAVKLLEPINPTSIDVEFINSTSYDTHLFEVTLEVEE